MKKNLPHRFQPSFYFKRHSHCSNKTFKFSRGSFRVLAYSGEPLLPSPKLPQNRAPEPPLPPKVYFPKSAAQILEDKRVGAILQKEEMIIGLHSSTCGIKMNPTSKKRFIFFAADYYGLSYSRTEEALHYIIQRGFLSFRGETYSYILAPSALSANTFCPVRIDFKKPTLLKLLNMAVGGPFTLRQLATYLGSEIALSGFYSKTPGNSMRELLRRCPGEGEINITPYETSHVSNFLLKNDNCQNLVPAAHACSMLIQIEKFPWQYGDFAVSATTLIQRKLNASKRTTADLQEFELRKSQIQLGSRHDFSVPTLTIPEALVIFSGETLGNQRKMANGPSKGLKDKFDHNKKMHANWFEISKKMKHPYNPVTLNRPSSGYELILDNVVEKSEWNMVYDYIWSGLN